MKTSGVMDLVIKTQLMLQQRTGIYTTKELSTGALASLPTLL